MKYYVLDLTATPALVVVVTEDADQAVKVHTKYAADTGHECVVTVPATVRDAKHGTR